MRYFLFPGAAAMLGAVASPVAAAPDDGPSNSGPAVLAANKAFANHDCAQVASILAPIIALPSTAEPADLSRIYDISISCAMQTKDMAKATDFAKHAIALPEVSDFAWHMAIGLSFDAKDFGGGIDIIDRMLADGRRETLNTIDPRWLVRAQFALQQMGDDANETRLLAILADPAYDPADVQAQIESIGDYARALYARKLLAAGKRDEARAMVSDIKGYETMAQVAFDPGLSALLGGPVDLRAVVEADLARHRALSAHYSRALSAITEVSFDLRRLGRYDEDIAFLTAAIPDVEKPGSFGDGDDKLPWFWNALAYGYFMTGKYDAMVAALKKGNRPNKDGSPNGDLVLNLAGYQVDFDRPKDALATLDTLSGVPGITPGGSMRFHLSHGCAAAELADLKGARADLAYALAHEKDDPATVTGLELCVGDDDAAAASYIRRLKDTNHETRKNAILALADYDSLDPRAPKSPFADREKRVRKRPDVVAALRAVGGPVRIHLQVEP